MELSKPSLTRLARRAGIKSISEECFPTLRNVILQKLDIIIQNALIVNSEHQTKTLMTDDIYESLYLLGENITQSQNLGTNIVTK